ncbi:MAG: pyruvate dehydrogenase complex dihydrolipoamide acetyltransferase [Proteobacteria bacterium]|nr:pyruvate dehydrogenase complex dihydrolipoamide acetyltransferase [Pseudomonadota bacterium]
MPIDVLMPQLSPTMTEGRLAKWTRKEGDKISAGDVIAEVETDKATMEVEASDDGILHMIIGQPGADLPVGAPIAVLRGKDEKVAADYKPKGKVAEKKVEVKKEEPKAAPVVTVAPVVVPVKKEIRNQKSEIRPVVGSGRVKASPLAKRLAADSGVNLALVRGSGPQGRVVAADVKRSGGGGGHPLMALLAGSGAVRGSDRVEKVAPMRRAIAARLLQSKQTVPHFYLTRSADMRRLMDARAELNEMLAASGQKLTVNDFIVKACGLALRDFPMANASWGEGGEVTTYGNVDISVAVAIEGGLVTPIVFNADAKGLGEISGEVKQLAADARAGKLKPAQYEGGSFSISNLGMYGIEEFSAIINPPQAAILAVGATGRDGMMKLTLSVDHRVIDGALGAELLGAIVGYLEQPKSMVG